MSGNQAPTQLPLVAVLLGSDRERFDRLVRWATELASVGPCTVFVQYGATPLPALLPSRVDGVPTLDAEGRANLLRRSDAVVVAASAPGLVRAARSAGHRPVVVPRDPARGERPARAELRRLDALVGTGTAVRAGSQAAFEVVVHEAVLARRSRRVASPSGTPRASRLGERFAVLADGVVHAPRRKAGAR